MDDNIVETCQKFSIDVPLVANALVDAMKDEEWWKQHRYKDYELPAWLKIFYNVGKLKTSSHYSSKIRGIKFNSSPELEQGRGAIWEVYRRWKVCKDNGKECQISDRCLVVRDCDNQYWAFHHAAGMIDPSHESTVVWHVPEKDMPTTIGIHIDRVNKETQPQ